MVDNVALNFNKSTCYNPYIRNILNKDGKIFIEIPNFDYFIKQMPHYAVFHQHLNMYDLKNLKN